jgi:hypothetical protein
LAPDAALRLAARPALAFLRRVPAIFISPSWSRSHATDPDLDVAADCGETSHHALQRHLAELASWVRFVFAKVASDLALGFVWRSRRALVVGIVLPSCALSLRKHSCRRSSCFVLTAGTAIWQAFFSDAVLDFCDAVPGWGKSTADHLKRNREKARDLMPFTSAARRAPTPPQPCQYGSKPIARGALPTRVRGRSIFLAHRARRARSSAG